jgi:hypothetical protein
MNEKKSAIRWLELIHLKGWMATDNLGTALPI